ncbi:hypothetical protein AX16_008580 [Volvariella volvacea WC 439]|nr:hypothetical protein AX16_008580 [Volvariella volvacea WC 439]
MAPGLLFVSLCIPLAFALPLSTHQLQPSTILARALEVDPQFRRPLFNIVWSSLITIATCTYSALHPNVPNPAATTREVFQERLWMTFFAVLAPDMMILCAAMQRNAAKKIYEEFRHNGA